MPVRAFPFTRAHLRRHCFRERQKSRGRQKWHAGPFLNGIIGGRWRLRDRRSTIGNRDLHRRSLRTCSPAGPSATTGYKPPPTEIPCMSRRQPPTQQEAPQQHARRIWIGTERLWNAEEQPTVRASAASIGRTRMMRRTLPARRNFFSRLRHGSDREHIVPDYGRIMRMRYIVRRGAARPVGACHGDGNRIRTGGAPWPDRRAFPPLPEKHAHRETAGTWNAGRRHTAIRRDVTEAGTT